MEKSKEVTDKKRKLPRGLYEDKHGYYSEFIIYGKRTKKRWGKDVSLTFVKEQHEKLRVEVREGKYKPKRKDPLFKDFVKDDFLPWSKETKKEKTYIRDNTSCNHLVPSFGSKRLSEVDTKMVVKYRSSRIKEGAKKATINREVAALRNIYNQAMEWGDAEKNPTKGVKPYKEPPEKMWVLTPEQEEKLLERLGKEPGRKYVRDVVEIGLYSGARLGEILSLQKVQIAEGLSSFHVPAEKSKSGHERTVPIPSNLKGIFRAAIKGKGLEEYLFPAENGGPQDSIRWWFLKGIKDCGLGREKTDKTTERFRFHDLRHTFITRMVVEGADLATVAEIVGHVDLKMMRRYYHPTPEHMTESMERVVTKYKKKPKKK